MQMSECPVTCRVGIVIVEDEKALVRLYERTLAKNGIAICFIAYDGLEAVKKYMECTPPPHAIIMDYRLPIMNGIEATKEILKFDPQVKVVFLSADMDVKEEAMRAGAFMFLLKPVSLDILVDSVKRAIGKVPA
jgi:two-component system, chemotaxis family, chemotaxis protein CheY